MTRILDVRFLLIPVMTTVLFGCSSGSSGSPPSGNPTNKKYSDFMSLKAQIISAGLPLNADGRDFNRRILSAARELGLKNLRPVQVELRRYVRLGEEVEALLGTRALTLPDTNTFADDFDKGRIALNIVDSELGRGEDDWGNGRPSERPGPPEQPPHREPPAVGPQLPPYTPSQAASDCANWAEKLNRPCQLEKGRIVNKLFVGDPNGQDICHCPSGTFEKHSETRR